MVDETTLILVGTALAGLAAVVQHFYDRFAKRGLYLRSARLAADLPTKIGSEVENALERVAARQEAKYGEQAKAAEVELAKQGTFDKHNSLVMSGTRQIGLEKAEMRELQGLMVDGVLGPAMQAIEAWNPVWAERLRQVPPDLLIRFLESPWFIANIKPRIQPYLDKFMGNTAGVTMTEGGWGT